MDEIGDEDVMALGELEERAVAAGEVELERSDFDARRAAIEENVRRSRAMVDARRDWSDHPG